MGKKEKIENIKENVSDALELPKEITLNLPKVTMVGSTQIRIENHKGIIEYSESKIRVNSKIGIIVITGKNLFIRNIIKEEVLLEGKLESVQIDG
ncbi:sporulation protein YqfC [Alkalibaculum bacchi]|uniref:Sporulation protein YqfC n=1 Tax=Alkalibaculum bacchi TaxID=645887 RepID=A0A366ID51_9FIRM|nr:sporulation protein YqfC [Alkalibaculum bacchi]RBP68915.1 sporulation protein YqfC [Alkalibaculum bacchi]